MSRIGMSYWGLCQNITRMDPFDTPDGFRGFRHVLVDELSEKRGHKVFALQKRRENVEYHNLDYRYDSFPDLDLLFVEWRWPTWKNSSSNKTESDLDRQTELLEYYHGKIPIVLLDTDFRITREDEEKWHKDVTIFECALSPRKLTRKRVRFNHWFNPEINFANKKDKFQYGYLGNNYERKEMFERYYSRASVELRKTGIQTTVVGNWLDTSVEREYPEDLIKSYRFVSFIKRPVTYWQALKYLESFLCTTHLTKKEYAKHGAVAPRYFETLGCHVPAFVPSNFMVPDILGKNWVVEDEADVVRKITLLKKLKHEDRIEIVQEQKKSLLKHGKFSVQEAADTIEHFIK